MYICRNADQVAEVMDQVNEQRQVADEISDAISAPFGEQMDAVSLQYRLYLTHVLTAAG